MRPMRKGMFMWGTMARRTILFSVIGLLACVLAGCESDPHAYRVDKTPAPHVIFEPFAGAGANYWFIEVEQPAQQYLAQLLPAATIRLSQQRMGGPWNSITIEPDGRVKIIHPQSRGNDQLWQITESHLSPDALRQVQAAVMTRGFAAWPLGSTASHAYRGITPETPAETNWRVASLQWRAAVLWLAQAQSRTLDMEMNRIRDAIDREEKRQSEQRDQLSRLGSKVDEGTRTHMQNSIDNGEHGIDAMEATLRRVADRKDYLDSLNELMQKVPDAEFDPWLLKDMNARGTFPPPPARPELPDYIRPDGTIDRYDYDHPFAGYRPGTWAVVRVSSGAYDKSSVWESTFTAEVAGLFADVETIVLDPSRCKVTRQAVVDVGQIQWPATMPATMPASSIPAKFLPATSPDLADPATTQPVSSQPVR